MRELEIENECKRKGREEERADNLKKAIIRSAGHGISEEQIISEIMEDYELSREEAETKVREYCLQPQ